jgi:branched-chain amino acid transport system ATP-binding protein
VPISARKSEIMGERNMLVVRGLSVAYGRLVAVRDVSFTVARGAMVAIIGPNGAGKSTTLAAIAGGVKARTGTVTLDGGVITGARPEAIAERGISLVPESRHVFASMTVEENLWIGSFMRGNRAEMKADLAKILHRFPRLRERLHEAGGKLSGGEQQMLVIARALMTRPRLLLIDEPSLGLAPKAVDEVYDLLDSLRRSEALTVWINEQNSRRVLKFADEVHVLREGRIQLSGKCGQLEETTISQAYFGIGGFDHDAMPGAAE